MAYLSSPPSAAFYTLGCRVNQYESEALAEELGNAGFRIAPFTEVCDVYVVNTCAVTEESVRKSRQIVRRAKSRNPDAFVAVCGCASQLDPDGMAQATGADFVCGTRDKRSLLDAVLRLREQTGKGSPVIRHDAPDGPIEPLSIARFPRARAYIKIQDGCNGRCAYCVIAKVRGPSVSRPRADILAEVKRIAESGVKEIVLTGVETSSYDDSLPDLIDEASRIPGIERIRLGSLDPASLTPAFTDRLFSNPAFMPHLHLSLQSGSSSVLGRMRRRYRYETVRDAVFRLREQVPDLQLSADLIVGFPGETDEEFIETLRAADELRLLHGHIFPYSPRPGTDAALMPDQIPKEVKLRRFSLLSDQCEAQKNAILASAVQACQPVPLLIEEKRKDRLVGHTPSFMEASVPYDRSIRRGQILSVLPEGSENGILLGRILPR